MGVIKMENDRQIIHPWDSLRNDSYKDYIETLKGASFNADYLTWSVCWDKLKEFDQTAHYEMVTYEYESKPFCGIMNTDGTVMVHARIYYEDKNGDPNTHDEYLAVRDFRNNAVVNPDTAQIENTFRRAVAKGVSMLTGFGIGLWMNEDVRELESYRPETHPDGSRPKPGMITVAQTVKPNALRLDKNISPRDKLYIDTIKSNGWKDEDGDITETEAQIVINNIKAGIKNSRPATKARIAKAVEYVKNSDMTDEKKEKTIEWLTETRSNNELLALETKLQSANGANS